MADICLQRKHIEENAINTSRTRPGFGAKARTNTRPTIVERMNPTPTSHVTVVSRSVQAVNYEHRSGASKLDFEGTDLMPQASGQAKVESKKGYIEIEAEFANLERPTTFDNEYLTYILWAISPEGRAVTSDNVGGDEMN